MLCGVLILKQIADLGKQLFGRRTLGGLWLGFGLLFAAVHQLYKKEDRKGYKKKIHDRLKERSVCNGRRRYNRRRIR